MENESGAKIAIRGKGSVKEGKGRSDAAHTSNQEEDLHCLIMAETEDKVNKAKQLIHNVIETVRTIPCSQLSGISTDCLLQAASIPEGQNELKRGQLRELAALNGTLRDDENQACQNCMSSYLLAQAESIELTYTGGQIGHRKYDCPEQRNFTANIICRVCGNAGHMARDCPDRQRGSDSRNNPGGFSRPQGRVGGGDAVDREMEQLFQELGGAPGSGEPTARIEAGPGSYDQGDPYGGERQARPWEKGPTGSAAPWARPRDEERDNYGGGSAAPPWAQRKDNYGGYSGGGAPGGAPGAAAPWQQQSSPPPPPPGGQDYGYGYPGADTYGGQSGYSQQNLGAPPGLPAMYQQFQAPPPPPGSGPPPPPPSDGPPP